MNYRLGIGYGFDFQNPAGAGIRGASEYQDIKAAGERSMLMDIPLWWPYTLLLPGLAVLVRRLRDAGYAWPWVLIGLVPLAGVIILLVFLCQPSKQRFPVYAPAYSPLQ